MRKPRLQIAATLYLQYWHGDHFKSWIGPTVPEDAVDYHQKMEHLERVFQSANILKECACNWRDGLISEPFTWFLKGVDGERVEEADEAAAEAELQLQRWLDWVAQQAIYADPLCSDFQQEDPWAEFVVSLGVTGKSALRLWQPQRYADAEDLIHRYHLHATKEGQVTVERSPTDGFIDKLFYAYPSGREEHTMDGSVSVVKTTGQEAELRVDADGRWLIQIATGNSIFTPSVRRLQDGLNHALTMMVRNVEVAGFREKVFANAEYPTDDDGNPIAVERGPGRDLYLYGVPTGDTNNPGYTPVEVFESQPVSTANLEQAVEVYRRLIYMQMSQGHLLSAGDGSLSGESRIQMRGQFELHLKGWRRRVESAIANVLNIVLRLLGYDQFEVVVGLNITTGKLSAEERQALIAEHQAGLLSKSTTISKLGSVNDVDAELALIEEEEKEASANRNPGPQGGIMGRLEDEPEDEADDNPDEGVEDDG